MKIFKKIIKRFIYAAFLLYGYNLISVEFNMMVPINLYNLGLVMFLGPFILGGITGGLISPLFYQRPYPYYYQPYPYYRPYYY